jgi:hypothetical protein
MPSTYPFDGDFKEWLPEASATSLTINPAGIPDGAVLFVIEHSPETGSSPMLEAGLVNKPAPTCWEATNYMTFSPPTGEPTPAPVTSSPTR